MARTPLFVWIAGVGIFLTLPLLLVGNAGLSSAFTEALFFHNQAPIWFSPSENIQEPPPHLIPAPTGSAVVDLAASSNIGSRPSAPPAISRYELGNDVFCIQVEGHVLAYMDARARGVRTLLGCGIWQTAALSSCDHIDTWVVSYPELSNVAVLRRTFSKLPNPPSMLIVDWSWEYGYYPVAQPLIAELFVATGMQENHTAAYVVGAGTLGEPHRRELNLFWLMPCTLQQNASSPSQTDADIKTNTFRMLCLGG